MSLKHDLCLNVMELPGKVGSVAGDEATDASHHTLTDNCPSAQAWGQDLIR
jgi:hypothetical protein